MWQDPIVAETRALRDEYARQFDYSINAIFDDLMTKQAAHPERVVSFPARKPAAGAVAVRLSVPGRLHSEPATTTPGKPLCTSLSHWKR
uniref:Uncharacterized protein n=1 Tax=Candidatus Kentrum sp. LPFa TaxID=2126335 RepID=A0A450WP47_9GAMM|nr:MAG: hypothetical protein BECKLPF1236B_GA0070989_11535 [Candidatus Kentron sp. LPFa]